MSLVAGSLMMYSCGDSKKEKEETVSHEDHEMHENSDHTHSENSGHSHSEKTVAAAEFKNDGVKQVFNQYLEVKDALVQTDAEAASEAAKELQVSLEENNPEIAKIAGNIAGENDVNKQREAFSELTAAMDPVLKQAISSGKIYKQFCPMAFEGKGDYWYSNSDQIRNPYFGDRMLKCGRVEETIQ
ncbi:DUF3347 domain-containing protein [Pontixanthobacter gangjinensis]|nr:DUF3347 domain-containing protein [Christiangramia aestuarii]